MAAVAEFPGVAAAGLAGEIERLRSCDLVAYADVARIKLAALRLAYRAFVDSGSIERRADFEEFCHRQGDALTRFAAFESLRAQLGSAWWEWPPQWRQPNREVLRDLRASHGHEIGFHEFVQWLADSQLGACSELARQRGLSVELSRHCGGH